MTLIVHITSVGSTCPYLIVTEPYTSGARFSKVPKSDLGFRFS